MIDNKSTASPFSVLYVDDEEKALKYFRRAVGDEIEVHTATGVPEALSILEERGEEIGVLVTDQRMPGQTGVDLLRKVRSDWPDMVRLLTTAYSDLDEAIEAVNRGEIFRYINKPWDVRQLRAEIRQALDVFHLKRERSLLLEEKLSVWQRLVEVNRIRDLVIMAGSFTHLRNATAAVAAYLDAHTPEGGTPAGLVQPEQLDLWSLTEREIRRTLALAEGLIRDTRGDGSAFDLSAGPRELLENAAPSGVRVDLQQEGAPRPLNVNRSLAETLMETLLRAASRDGAGEVTVQCAPATLDGGAPAAGFTFPRSTTARGTESREDDASLLTAYLIAFHHGGRIEPLQESGSLRLLLPEDPEALSLREPQANWLQHVLARLERWD